MPHRLAILLAALALTLSSTRSICAQPTTGQSTNDRQSSACTDPLPLADYLRLLRASHAAAIHGNQVGLAEVAPALVATTCVALNTDQSAPADNRWLAQALDQPRPDVPQIAAHLGALIDVLSYPAAPDAAAAEQRLRDILAQPPFAQPERSDKPGWLERFLQWLNDLFGSRVVPADHVQPKGSQGISWLITLIGLLTIGAVLAIWLRGLRWASAPLTRRPDEDPEVALSAAEATRQADSLAHSGDYRRAARMLYLSALLWLHEQGRLRYDRSLTNREHLDRLGEQSALRERLRPVIETFDSVWYGDLPLDATSFATYERQVEALRDV